MTSSTLQRLVEPLEDFEVWYEGELLKIRAGVGSFFATDHEVVRKFPEKFGVARAIVLGGARVSAAREQKTATPPQPTATRRPVAPAAPVGPSLPVHMTTGKPLRITQRAMAVIAETCARWRGEIETGGSLILNVSDRPPVIVDATENASDRSHDAVHVNLNWIILERRMQQRHATARLACGHWHSHPRRSVDPSDADLAVWQELLGMSRDSEVFGVIVTEKYDADRWQHTPTLTAYRVRIGPKPITGADVLLVERCDVEQRR
jgi:proteasome lid subunit RPN8/RPN11